MPVLLFSPEHCVVVPSTGNRRRGPAKRPAQSPPGPTLIATNPANAVATAASRNGTALIAGPGKAPEPWPSEPKPRRSNPHKAHSQLSHRLANWRRLQRQGNAPPQPVAKELAAKQSEGRRRTPRAPNAEMVNIAARPGWPQER